MMKLTNSNGMEAIFTDFGATLVSLLIPQKQGPKTDVVLGYREIDFYRYSPDHPYFGSTIGRFGNRVAHGKFTLEGKTYQLACNNNQKHHLHGGTSGFDQKIWTIENHTSTSITFSYLSPDGEENYPGNLKVFVTYRLTNENALEIEYHATTDQVTPVNLTNHTYFNLNGEGSSLILDHEIQIFSDHYTVADHDLIPTGEIALVEGTPFDLRQPTLIGKNIESDHPQMSSARGYDLNYCLRELNGTLRPAARVKSDITQIEMRVETTEPGVQFYTGNFLDGTRTGKSGKPHLFRSGFCLETQHYPDSPNHPHFPSTLLHPGTSYQSKTLYRFQS